MNKTRVYIPESETIRWTCILIAPAQLPAKNALCKKVALFATFLFVAVLLLSFYKYRQYKARCLISETESKPAPGFIFSAHLTKYH